jgi:predicted dehydrogenase
MLDAEALDFVDIASPPAFHAAAARLVIEAGVNAIVEKPLCLNPGEFSELTAMAARSGRLLLCVHNWKYAPAYQRAHELISSGELGGVQYLSLVRLRDQPAGEGGRDRFEQWRLNPQAGGGILIDHGWHTFYLAYWLMGGEMPVSVSCRLGFRPPPAIDDLAHLRIDFPGDRIADIYLSWRAPVRRTSATLQGSEALIEIEAERVVLTRRSGVPKSWELADASPDSYHAAWFSAAAADLEKILARNQSDEAALTNLREAAVALAVTAAARESARDNGRTVAVVLPALS